jgi:hypothetical protein
MTSSPALADTDTCSIYEAVPLPLGMFIRVIHIRPSEVSDHSDPVACDFHLLSLENELLCELETESRLSDPEQVQYTALSYTWGHSTPLHTIYLDDKPFSVRQNLWNFLRMARNTELTGYLWIDALCINQEVVEERNHQVWMMGKIYTGAERVIVWLGVVSSNVGIFMKKIATINPRYWSPSIQWQQAASEFCQLAYWSRAWILQEYVLAKKVHVWCGRSLMDEVGLGHGGSMQRMPIDREEIQPEGPMWMLRIDGSRLGCDSEMISDIRYRNSPACKVIAARDIRDMRFGMKALRGTIFPSSKEIAQERETPLDKLPFIHILRFLDPYHLQCADRRDRVYSLLSLLCPAERARLAVIPDYSKPA